MQPPSENGRTPLPEDRVRYWEARCTHYPQRRAILLPLLHDLQDHVGYISKDAMVWAADFVGISPVEVYGVVTFYWMYALEERAKFRIAVCHNISCDLRGKDAVLLAIREELEIDPKTGRSEDGDWSLETVECMGSCTTAPMMDVNGRYFEELCTDSVRKILVDIRSGKEELLSWPFPLNKLPEDKLVTAHPLAGKGEDA